MPNEPAESTLLLRYLVIASSSHRELAISLQSIITTFYTKLSKSIEEAWRDRETILVEVVESGGMGLNGDVEKAREVVMPVVSAWKGLGVLAR
jgi:elongator complex protein 1